MSSVVPEPVELAPLTYEQIAAIRACRWSTTNALRTICWLWTNNDRVHATLSPIVSRDEEYTRDRHPVKREWEMLSGRDDIIAVVLEEMRKRDPVHTP